MPLLVYSHHEILFRIHLDLNLMNYGKSLQTNTFQNQGFVTFFVTDPLYLPDVGANRCKI